MLPYDPLGVHPRWRSDVRKGVVSKRVLFWRMFACNKNWNEGNSDVPPHSTKNRDEGTFGCSPVPKNRTRHIRQTFLQNHPFVSSRRGTQRSWRDISMPRGKNCGETICAAQVPSPRGQFSKRTKNPLLWGRGNLGGILRDNLGEGNYESKIAARHWGINFYREHLDVLQGPLGKRQNHWRTDVQQRTCKMVWFFLSG